MKLFVILVYATLVSTTWAMDRFQEKARVSASVRDQILARAQVWHAVNIAQMNLREGPSDNNLHDDAILNCRYIDMNKYPLAGSTPKFQCEDATGRIYKIKYGQHNGEVYGSVVASRLLWALGFGADHVIPVQVNCLGCSKDPWLDKEPRPRHREVFNYAVVIVRPNGPVIYSGHDEREGVDLNELYKITAEKGGATAEQIDAFKLVLSLIAHVDNKPDNQALVCLNSNYDNDGDCHDPLVYVHDLGTTFSAANGHLGFHKFNLARYAEMPTWQDPESCVTGLKHGSHHSHTLSHPQIGEGGRKFLSSLLTQLTHQQVLDAFAAAHVENFNSAYTPEAWAAAFEEKIRAVTAHPGCGK